jgi:hypothetical protein
MKVRDNRSEGCAMTAVQFKSGSPSKESRAPLVRRSSCAVGARQAGYTKDTPNRPGGEIVRDASGAPTGLLLAKPNAGIPPACLSSVPVEDLARIGRRGEPDPER